MSIPRNWSLQQQRYRLAGKVCERCDRVIFPSRNVCPECDDMAQTPLFFVGFPVEVVGNGDARVLVYGYQSRLVTLSTS